MEQRPGQAAESPKEMDGSLRKHTPTISVLRGQDTAPNDAHFDNDTLPGDLMLAELT